MVLEAEGIELLREFTKPVARTGYPCPYYELRCHCGRTFSTKGASIRAGRTKSCGCGMRRQQRRFSNYSTRRQAMLDRATQYQPQTPTLPKASTEPPKADLLLDEFATRLKALRQKNRGL